MGKKTKRKNEARSVISIVSPDIKSSFVVNISGKEEDFDQEIEEEIHLEEESLDGVHLQEGGILSTLEEPFLDVPVEKFKESYSFELIENREGLLKKQQRKNLDCILYNALIFYRPSKKGKLEKIWKENGLGLLRKSKEEFNEYRFEDFDFSFPGVFNLRDVVVVGRSYKSLVVFSDEDSILVWKEEDPSVVVQFPFLFEEGNPKTVVLEKNEKQTRNFKFQGHFLNKEGLEEGYLSLSKGVIKKLVEKSEIKYIFSLEDPKLAIQDWVIDQGENIYLEKRASSKMFCITKAIKEKRFVYGPVLIPETVDGQNEIVSEEEIRKAAWEYLEEYGTTSFMHTTTKTVEGIRPQIEVALLKGYTVEELFNGVSGDPLVPGIKNALVFPATFTDKLKIRESYLAPIDFELGTRKIKKGTWIMGMHIISDLLWDHIQSGKITGFSVEGYSVGVLE